MGAGRWAAANNGLWAVEGGWWTDDSGWWAVGVSARWTMGGEWCKVYGVWCMMYGVRWAVISGWRRGRWTANDRLWSDARDGDGMNEINVRQGRPIDQSHRN